MTAGSKCVTTVSLLSIDEGKVARIPVKEAGPDAIPAGVLPAEKQLERDKTQPHATDFSHHD